MTSLTNYSTCVCIIASAKRNIFKITQCLKDGQQPTTSEGKY